LTTSDTAPLCRLIYAVSFSSGLADELQGKPLGDGLVHRVAYNVARAITWDAERTAAAG
jgi:hypothetical protein